MKDPIFSNITIQNFDDVDSTLKEIALSDSFITTKEAEMNEEINKIRSKYDEATKDSRARKQLLEQEIEGYCKINKDVFGTTKTKALIFGKVFFRTNPPKVSQLNKKYSAATSIELIKKLFKNKFLRTKEEVDKEEILAAYAAQEINDQKLAAIGLKIDQDEKFGYEINWEALDNNQ